jgi:hypothetical protein
MTTAIAATIFSVLSKPSCSLDVFDPCIIDRMESKSSVDSVSSEVDTTILSATTSHPTGHIPLQVGRDSPRPTGTTYKPTTLAPEQMDLNLPKTIPTSVYYQKDRVQITPSRILRARISSVEERCDHYRRELRRSISEVAHDKPKPPRPHKSSDGGEVEGKDIPCEMDVNIIPKTKQKQRRSTRLVGSASEPLLPNATTRTGNRKPRPLNLAISGTPKFRLNYDSNAGTRPKLVKLQNGWRRIGKR